MKSKLPLITTVGVIAIALLSFLAIAFVNRKSLPNLIQTGNEPSFIAPKMEFSPYRIQEDTAVFKFTTLPESKISQIKITTDLKKTAEWQNITTYIQIPVADLGNSGKVYVQGRTPSGELTEIISDTINPSSPPVEIQ